MKRVLLLCCVALFATASAAQARPVDHPESRGWLYADRAAQAAAEWIFPQAAHPFGTVIERRGCDRQRDGSYDCVYTLGVWSSGRWRGRRAPASVERWHCSGPMTVTVRRGGNGEIARSSDANPCQPAGAADAHDALLLFVAAVHRRRPSVGRLRDVHCYDQRSLVAPTFHCYGESRQVVRVSADIDINGAVILDSERPRPQAPAPKAPGNYVATCRATADQPPCPVAGAG